MHTPRSAVLSLLFVAAFPVWATEPLCGTSPETDARLHALRERSGPRIVTQAVAPPATTRDGAIYIEADDAIVLGYRPFDLDNVSLVFEPRGATSFAMRREPLRYVEPAGEPIVNFQSNNATPFAITRDLGFTFPVFGRSITRVHLSAFNAIHLDEPVQQSAMIFDDLEAAVHRGAVLSPLMITSAKPRYLAYPEVFVDETADALRVTWRSTAGVEFTYDIQAELHRDGSVIYSYRSVSRMRWGAPILSAGFDPASVPRALLGATGDATGETAPSIPPTVMPMLDIAGIEVFRIADSDLYSVKVKVAGAIETSKIPSGQTLQYIVRVGSDAATVDVARSGTRVTSFSSMSAADDGASAHVDGDTLEVFGMQFNPSFEVGRLVRVQAYYRPGSNFADQALVNLVFTPAPKRVASDLSAVEQGAVLQVPIAEPFVLGALDPNEVYARVQPQFALSDYDYDAIAIYQSFYTDIIFFAGAYATRGNAQVSGIAPDGTFAGTSRAPTLLHLNQLTYNYNASAKTASKVILHEFGHRWLYFFSIRENGQNSRVLNPLSAHPAAYVDTRSVFRVYDENESSVMGGAFFTQQSDGLYKARALNHGYSWADLYLMGLAAPEEVQPWFYLNATDPALPGSYWPADGVIVSGEKRAVAVDQILAVHGARSPSVATSQKHFRVAFVLVTEPGKDATDAEVAKMNEWRALFARNFAIATGGRGAVETTVVRLRKPRAVR